MKLSTDPASGSYDSRHGYPIHLRKIRCRPLRKRGGGHEGGYILTRIQAQLAGGGVGHLGASAPARV